MNAKRVFIPIAFVTCASIGIVPAVYADVPSAQVTPLEEGVAAVGGVLGTDYTMDAATRGRCRRGRMEPLLVQRPACIFLVQKLGTAVLHQPSTVGGYVQRFI